MDRNRDGYLRRNLNHLPADVVEKLKSSTANDRRRLTNEVVVRDDNGNWSINVSAPILKEWQEKYVDVRKDKGLITKPAGLAATMWGGWTSLKDATHRGEVWVVVHKEKDYYQWREFTETEREGHRGGVSTQGRRKLDLATYHTINRALQERKLDLQLRPKELKDWANDENRPPPQKVFDKFEKVRKACQKAYNDARETYREVKNLPPHDILAAPIAAKLKQDFEATLSDPVGSCRILSWAPGLQAGFDAGLVLTQDPEFGA